MFRTAILRAARLPRAASASSASVVASLRPTTLRTAGLAQTTAFQSRVVPALSHVARFGRSYSTETATAAAQQAPEAERGAQAPGLVTRFSELEPVGVHKNLVESLTKGMRYENMTSVQSMTIVPALAGKDIVAQAKTGTGKTLAFLIPIIQRIINDQPELAYHGRSRANAGDIRAIVMSPTRELAEQIGEEARTLVRGTGIVVQTAVGGTQKNMMLNRTRREGCHLLVATPGRLNDILTTYESGIAAPKLGALVLDEADRMLDVGFDRELRDILQYLPDRAQVPRQTLLFSATVPKNVVSLARTYVDAKNFEFVQTIRPEDVLTHEKVPQHIVSVKGYENIYPTMLELFEREILAANAQETDRMPFKAIVFLPTTNMVQLTQDVFFNLNREHVALPRQYHIHSKLTQRARTDAAERFRKAKSGILYSSDVTARGMDFPNVTHVIQIGVPPDREQYIHRLGRTGRADKGGQGWTIVAANELEPARNILTDLPIQRVAGFVSADYDMSVKNLEDEPQQVKAIAKSMKMTPTGLLVEAYMSFLGGASMGRKMQTTCDNINNWVYNGWGWKETPAIEEGIALKRGLHKIRGMNIKSRRSGGHASSSQNSNGIVGADEFEQQFSSNFGGSDRRSGGNSGGYSRGSGGNSGGYSRDNSRRNSGGFSRGSNNNAPQGYTRPKTNDRWGSSTSERYDKGSFTNDSFGNGNYRPRNRDNKPWNKRDTASDGYARKGRRADDMS